MFKLRRLGIKSSDFVDKRQKLFGKRPFEKEFSFEFLQAAKNQNI